MKVSRHSILFLGFNYYPDPVSLVRDHTIKQKLGELGISVQSYNGDLLYEPWESVVSVARICEENRTIMMIVTSVEDTKETVGSRKVKIVADMLLNEASKLSYDLIILPVCSYNRSKQRDWTRNMQATITVILTAKHEQRGLEAVKKLKESAGLSDDQIIFHRLDVADPSSVSALADFIKTKFGKLDILVNNAGIGGIVVDEKGFQAQVSQNDKGNHIYYVAVPDNKCIFPRSPTLALSMTVAVVLTMAQTILNVATGCFCCTRGTYEFDPKRAGAFVFSTLS